MYPIKRNKQTGLSPWRDLLGTERMLSRFWDEFLQDNLPEEATFSPSVKITETDKSYNLTAELAGIAKDDVKVDVDGNILTIRAEKRKPELKENENSHYDEISYGSYVRRMSLPDGVDTENIRAEHKDGVLALTLPKSEKHKPREIKVK